MLCYFIAKKDFSLLSCIEVNQYTVSHDIDCGGKTKLIIAGDPKAAAEDFVVLRDHKQIQFVGIIEKVDNVFGEIKRTITCLEIERMFDQKIFLSDVEMIRNVGIEDFIVHTINSQFAHTGDNFVDMPYIRCTASTHTPVNGKPEAENGVYNFKTYIGNVKEHYGIFLDFEFGKDELRINVHKRVQESMQIDTTLTDVNSSSETYEIKALSKLNVVWHNLLTNEEIKRTFFLHTDRSVSEVDENRVNGYVSALYLAKETEEEMLEDVSNEFRSNSYSHLIEADIFKNSKLYPADQLYVGHEVKIKSAAGIKESIISGVSFSSDANTISIKFGNLKVTLTDKIK